MAVCHAERRAASHMLTGPEIVRAVYPEPGEGLRVATSMVYPDVVSRFSERKGSSLE
jgi:hypothetical protein